MESGKELVSKVLKKIAPKLQRKNTEVNSRQSSGCAIYLFLPSDSEDEKKPEDCSLEERKKLTKDFLKDSSFIFSVCSQ
jgi:hypothetical protein